MSLSHGQAGIAATIAGVAQQDALPPRAVTVAYAAALQESKLTNLTYGDRDSVGVFQQRPSEGWGTRSQLEDPVYATSKFFDALTKVPDYEHLPVYKAAQAVQHSADGSAYDQYQPMATQLTSAFTGHHPHAVWCWYRQEWQEGPARRGARRAGQDVRADGDQAHRRSRADRAGRPGPPGGRWRPGWCRTRSSTASLTCNTTDISGPRRTAQRMVSLIVPGTASSSSADNLRSVGTEEESKK